jgi:hypothetical protein
MCHRLTFILKLQLEMEKAMTVKIRKSLAQLSPRHVRDVTGKNVWTMKWLQTVMVFPFVINNATSDSVVLLA